MYVKKQCFDLYKKTDAERLEACYTAIIRLDAILDAISKGVEFCAGKCR